MDTKIRMSVVTVKRLPGALGLKRRRNFFREIQDCMSIDRPRVVLDCSSVQKPNRALVHLLLRCLEEAMKRHGDVKLAAVSSEAKAVLEHSGVLRLFDTFDTTAEAVNSFYDVPASMVPQAFVTGGSRQESENAT